MSLASYRPGRRIAPPHCKHVQWNSVVNGNVMISATNVEPRLQSFALHDISVPSYVNERNVTTATLSTVRFNTVNHLTYHRCNIDLCWFQLLRTAISRSDIHLPILKGFSEYGISCCCGQARVTARVGVYEAPTHLRLRAMEQRVFWSFQGTYAATVPCGSSRRFRCRCDIDARLAARSRGSPLHVFIPGPCVFLWCLCSRIFVNALSVRRNR